MEEWFVFAFGRFNYWIVIILMMVGLYTVFARGNLVKKIVGLNLFQTSVFIFYITIAKIRGGTAPIFTGYGSDGHKPSAGHAPEGYPSSGEVLSHGHAGDLPARLHEEGGDSSVPDPLLPDASSVHDSSSVDHVSGLLHETVAGHSAADGAVIDSIIYANPLPHVLILTAIVVGVATTAVGLALAVRIREAYGTIEEDDIDALDYVAEFGSLPGGKKGNAG